MQPTVLGRPPLSSGSTPATLAHSMPPGGLAPHRIHYIRAAHRGRFSAKSKRPASNLNRGFPGRDRLRRMPDLVEGARHFREWGRIGTQERHGLDCFEDAGLAADAMVALYRAKRAEAGHQLTETSQPPSTLLSPSLHGTGGDTFP